MDAVECWLTQQPEEEAAVSAAAGSVLDRYIQQIMSLMLSNAVMAASTASEVKSAAICSCRFKEDRNLMAIAGKGTSHSAGYREAPPEES